LLILIPFPIALVFAVVTDATSRDGTGVRLALLDAGLCAELNRNRHKNFVNIFYQVAQGNGREVR
jgi:predicted unusual protein kinase regulating ubiquinone biosynthesis (AarF/ABC1/UbiB family)